MSWSHSKESEFSRLAARKALGEASAEDMKRFYQLQALRRAKKNPPSAEEVLFQYRRREMEIKLLAQLQEYVAFLETPSRP